MRDASVARRLAQFLSYRRQPELTVGDAVGGHARPPPHVGTTALAAGAVVVVVRAVAFRRLGAFLSNRPDN